MNSYLKVNINLGELASLLGCQSSGNPDEKINFIGDINYIFRGFSEFHDNTIYFIESEPVAMEASTKNLKGIILTSSALAHYFPLCIFSEQNTRLVFLRLLEYFQKTIPEKINSDTFIHEKASIAKNSKIAWGACVGENAVVEENCIIHAGAVIEPDAVIKKGSVIHAGVFVGRHCIIGKNNILYPNAVIGAEGFGYFDFNNNRYKIPQIGNVVLGDNVEVGACTTIDRSTIESTIVSDNTKIDNLVQIAHNCIIGKNVYIAGKASMAGSVTVEDGAILAGGCGIKDHVKIAQKSIVLAFTGIEEDTEPGQTYFGIPARKAREMHRINSALNQLPEIIKKFKKFMDS